MAAVCAHTKCSEGLLNEKTMAAVNSLLTADTDTLDISHQASESMILPL